MSTLTRGTHVHLVGIGGAGMSALARILLERGHPVSGSDLRGGRTIAALSAMGAVVHTGHDASHVVGAQIVARSSAVPPTNPEVRRAEELGIPVLGRAQLLEALMNGRRRVLVAGTHGKTTTTAMIAVCLQAARLDPSFAIGGTLHEAGTGAHHGTGPLFVAEADESDGSFLELTPECAVVTNVELGHHDFYADLNAVHDAFRRFLDRRPPDGPAVVCADDPGAARLVDAAAPPVLTYGTTAGAAVHIADIQLDPAGATFALTHPEHGRFSVRLQLPGHHNVLNAAAAATAALWAGASPEDVRAGLDGYRGTQRRFHRLGNAAGVWVVDDYAHHPTELMATLAAARQMAPPGRLIAVFQPHRYSRTAALGHELGRALASADVAVVTDVYAAGEVPVPGVTGALVAAGAEEAGVPVRYVPSRADLAAVLEDLVGPGDVVLTLGAGDITDLGPELLHRLEGGRG